jgi:excisionase family DNA binding protein
VSNQVINPPLEDVNLEGDDVSPTVELPPKQYYTVADLAHKLGVPSHHIVRLVRTGKLHGQKVGTAYIISADEFDSWVKSGNFEYTPRKRGPRRKSVRA